MNAKHGTCTCKTAGVARGLAFTAPPQRSSEYRRARRTCTGCNITIDRHSYDILALPGITCSDSSLYEGHKTQFAFTKGPVGFKVNADGYMWRAVRPHRELVPDNREYDVPYLSTFS